MERALELQALLRQQLCYSLLASHLPLAHEVGGKLCHKTLRLSTQHRTGDSLTFQSALEARGDPVFSRLWEALAQPSRVHIESRAKQLHGISITMASGLGHRSPVEKALGSEPESAPVVFHVPGQIPSPHWASVSEAVWQGGSIPSFQRFFQPGRSVSLRVPELI